MLPYLMRRYCEYNRRVWVGTGRQAHYQARLSSCNVGFLVLVQASYRCGEALSVSPTGGPPDNGGLVCARSRPIQYALEPLERSAPYMRRAIAKVRRTVFAELN